MRTRDLPIMAAVWLGVLTIPLTGCNNPDSAVHAERDANGNTQVHVDNQKIDQNAKQANAELKSAGEQIKAGANEAGAAIERGAEKVNDQVQTKVVPAAKQLISDTNITAKVKSQLAGDPAINALTVKVDTSDGQVILSGKVALPEQKAEAEKVARQVDGVKDVLNRIDVVGQVPGK